MKIAIIITLTFLVGCQNIELTQHLEAEREFHAAVYDNDEYLADCQYYVMEECY